MKIQTTRFGALEVEPSRVLQMPKGLYGFEGQTRFVLLEHGQDSLFKWLQSMDDPELAFVVMEPSTCIGGYEIEISDSDAETLGLQNADDALALVILTIGKGGANVTANLVAPIIINTALSVGMQVVLENAHYALDQPLLEPHHLPEKERSAA